MVRIQGMKKTFKEIWDDLRSIEGLEEKEIRRILWAVNELSLASPVKDYNIGSNSVSGEILIQGNFSYKDEKGKEKKDYWWLILGFNPENGKMALRAQWKDQVLAVV